MRTMQCLGMDDSEFPLLPSSSGSRPVTSPVVGRIYTSPTRSYAASLTSSNTSSPVTRQPRSPDQENATTESLLNNSLTKTDEDVVFLDALEGPRYVRGSGRSSASSPPIRASVSSIGNFLGASSSNASPASGGSGSGGGNRRTPTGSHLLTARAHHYTPRRFAHNEGIRSGISNLNRTEILRPLGGGSGGAIPLPQPFPTSYPPFVHSPIPLHSYFLWQSPFSMSTNIYIPPNFEISPRTPNYPIAPQPPLQIGPPPVTTPHRPIAATDKSKSPLTINPPSEPLKIKSSPGASSSDAATAPRPPMTTVPPRPRRIDDWVPVDDGIECSLPGNENPSRAEVHDYINSVLYMNDNREPFVESDTEPEPEPAEEED